MSDVDSDPFWKGLTRGELLVQACQSCAKFRWQPRSLCPYCGEWEFEWRTMSGLGRLYSWSQVHRAPPPFDSQLPFLLGIVQLIEQHDLMMVGRLIGISSETVQEGLSVEVVFREFDGSTLVPAWQLREASYLPRHGSLYQVKRSLPRGA